MPMPELEWTGEYQKLETTEWFCPTYQNWAECNGPCPDGTPHTERRTREVMAKVMHIVQS